MSKELDITHVIRNYMPHDWRDKGSFNCAICASCGTIVGWDSIQYWEECPPVFGKKEGSP